MCVENDSVNKVGWRAIQLLGVQSNSGANVFFALRICYVMGKSREGLSFLYLAHCRPRNRPL